MDDLRASLAAMSEEDLHALAWRASWGMARLPHQEIPPGDWIIWLLMAGRGAGKTRTAAETLGQWAQDNPGTRWLVAAPTYGDLVGVCFEGDSGLLNVIPPALIQPTKSGTLFNKGDVELTLKNGSLIKGISAENPERFRGPQFHGGWFDEFAAWQYAEESYDMIMFGMRLGDRPRIIASTTPRPKPIIRQLLARDGKDVVVTRASTYDNMANLAPTFRDQILKYEGTALGRQEIHAEMMDPEEAGIIRRSWLKLWPKDKPLPVFEFIIVSLDTAFTEETRDKKTGERDPTACAVFGLFRHENKDGIMLLDCWEEMLGMPDLLKRVPLEMRQAYGDQDAPLIKPLFGKPLIGTPGGRKPDLLIIEDKGSGISLRQMLEKENIHAYAYNPGRASKVTRLHAVSHIFANGMIWCLESKERPGNPVSWADPLISQLCSFNGEGSVKHDDFVDATTQAIRLIVDRSMISVANPRDTTLPEQDYRQKSNPYAV